MAANVEPTHNGAGAPSDAAEAFAAALASAARKGLPEPAPDPRVAAAFALGWQIAVLYRPKAVRTVQPAAPDDLLSLGRLTEEQVIRMGLDRVQVALHRLHEPVHDVGLDLPDVAGVRAALLGVEDPEGRAGHIRDLHLALIGCLGAVDFRLVKAYGVGRAIADTCRTPEDLQRLQAEFSDARTALLANWIDDLASAFPPHAGHSVRKSLLRWRDWSAGARPEDVDAELLELLRRQGDLWRALLSGEKLGTDMLEIENYLDAADRAFTRIRRLSGTFLLRFPLLTAVIVLLFALGLGLLAVPVILGTSSASAVAAGLGGILTSVGLTWRGVGGTVGKLIGSFERPLWGAELDAAITEAITLRPTDRDTTGGKRELARALARSG